MKPEVLIWLKPANREFITRYLQLNFTGLNLEFCGNHDMIEKYRKMDHPIFITQHRIYTKSKNTKIINEALYARDDARVIILAEITFGKMTIGENYVINNEKNESRFKKAITKYQSGDATGTRFFACIGVKIETIFELPTAAELERMENPAYKKRPDAKQFLY